MIIKIMLSTEVRKLVKAYLDSHLPVYNVLIKFQEPEGKLVYDFILHNN